mmetsp:Transcript_36516/g.104592  ORF Transcript_36516/g.104592 Transcript_36516/m.104592 type:complete len:216 (-) Transcript_36516:41-688(-)
MAGDGRGGALAVEAQLAVEAVKNALVEVVGQARLRLDRRSDPRETGKVRAQLGRVRRVDRHGDHPTVQAREEGHDEVDARGVAQQHRRRLAILTPIQHLQQLPPQRLGPPMQLLIADGRLHGSVHLDEADGIDGRLHTGPVGDDPPHCGTLLGHFRRRAVTTWPPALVDVEVVEVGHVQQMDPDNQTTQLTTHWLTDSGTPKSNQHIYIINRNRH